MYKLYNVKAWGSVCVHFLLEEMEVPYTNIWLTPEQVKAPEFRAISPLGYIPALGLQDGRTLFESAAIVTFLLTAHPEKGLSPKPGTDDFGEFLSWLHFLSTNIYPAINMTFHGSGYALTPEQDMHLVSKAVERCDHLWGIVDRRLKEPGPWILDGHYTALDIYAFMLTLWSKPSETAVHSKFPEVARMAQAVRARPKLKAALEAHGILQLGGYGAS